MVLVGLVNVLVLGVLSVERLGVSVVGHWLLHHVGWNLSVSLISKTIRVLGLRSKVLVWVEATEGHDVSQAGELDHLRWHCLG